MELNLFIGPLYQYKDFWSACV